MEQYRTHRVLLRQLADRLIVEYAGILPPGQVLAAVFRANQSLARNGGVTGEPRLLLCESVVRQALTRRVEADPRLSHFLPSRTGALAS